MTEINNDLRINYLISGYEKYSNYLLEFQKHIEKCCTYKIINNKDRNNYIKIINDMVRQLNTTYNIAIFENESLFDNSIYDENITGKDLIQIHKVLNIKDIKDPYNEINNNILEKISHHIGFPSIDIALCLIIGEKYNYLYDKEINDKISFYNKIFIPLKYSTTSNNESDNKLLCTKQNDNDNLVLIDNCAKITLKNKDKHINLEGYFVNDPLNLMIRTSQLCHNFVFQKKKSIEKYISSTNDINDKFIKSYIRNIYQFNERV